MIFDTMIPNLMAKKRAIRWWHERFYLALHFSAARGNPIPNFSTTGRRTIGQARRTVSKQTNGLLARFYFSTKGPIKIRIQDPTLQKESV